MLQSCVYIFIGAAMSLDVLLCDCPDTKETWLPKGAMDECWIGLGEQYTITGIAAQLPIIQLRRFKDFCNWVSQNRLCAILYKDMKAAVEHISCQNEKKACYPSA